MLRSKNDRIGNRPSQDVGLMQGKPSREEDPGSEQGRQRTIGTKYLIFDKLPELSSACHLKLNFSIEWTKQLIEATPSQNMKINLPCFRSDWVCGCVFRLFRGIGLSLMASSRNAMASLMGFSQLSVLTCSKSAHTPVVDLVPEQIYTKYAATCGK